LLYAPADASASAKETLVYQQKRMFKVISPIDRRDGGKF